MKVTFAFPCRNRVSMANEAIQAVLDNSQCDILIIDDASDNPDGKYTDHNRVNVIYNKQKQGLVTSWNQILRESKTEYVIFGCDKIRVTETDINRIKNKLNEGYACVATYLMGIFGISKELTTRIGMFDEGYAVNGFEDTDWMNKLFINDLALYISTETKYLNTGSSWGHSDLTNKNYYDTKWREEPDAIVNLHGDVNADGKNYFTGQYEPKKYKSWGESVLLVPNIKNYYNNKKPIVMSEHKVRKSCAVCGNEHLETIMEYGNVPLAGDFPSKDELATDDKYNLNIQFCPKCSLLQTDSVVDADRLFKDYRYMSSIGLQNHFNGVAEKIKEKFNPEAVLEIGSNDGVLLKPLMDLGVNATGVDPATNICEIAKSKGCNVYNDYFSEDFVNRNGLENSYDFAVSNNCFAHIDDIQSIVRGVKKALKEGGHFQVEVHYVKPLIDKLQYDNIYHEHIYYYSLTALDNLFKQYGMTIVDFEELPIHAGSIRVIAKNSHVNTPEKVIERLGLEQKVWNITSLDYFTTFGDRTRAHIKSIKDTLAELKSQGKKIVGYGASGRANMVCNLSEITPDVIDYIVDESPERNGRHIAGTHVPIVGKNHLDNDPEKPDYVMIFAWNFSKMIIDKLEGNGYKYIVAFPEMQVVDSYEELKGFVSI